jgi:hypothetical protein
MSPHLSGQIPETVALYYTHIVVSTVPREVNLDMVNARPKT